MAVVLSADSLRQAGILILPLLLLSIAVVAVAIERIHFWWQWRQRQAQRLDGWLAELDSCRPSQLSLQQDLLVRRLQRSLSRWDPHLELALVLGPLLGLLTTVVGLMRLLQALGPDLVLPARSADLLSAYGQVLSGTVLGLLIALVALLVQRLTRMQRQEVIGRFEEACLQKRAQLA